MTTETDKKKAKSNEDGYSIEDKISNLPDAILSHILSFVSTQDAVRTSSLSTRWYPLWTSVAILNLNELDFYKTAYFRSDLNDFDFYYKTASFKSDKRFETFIKFLDRVLLDKKMPYIKKVTIKGESRYNTSLIKSWICAAVERNVFEFDLEVDKVYHSTIEEFPQVLFASNKLVVLKLCVKMIVNIPANQICFPNLKILELKKVVYKDDDSAQNLISSCPVIEDLTIVRFYFEDLVTLSVKSRVLRKLKVHCREGYGLDKRIIIDASALESIDIFDCVTEVYDVASDLSSLVKAKLHVSNSYSASKDSGSFEICITKLLQHIRNVKFLSFSSYTMQSLSYSESYELPKFQNLTCFELYTRTKVKSLDWELMMVILDCSPQLQNLVFWGLEFSWKGKTGTSNWDVPYCLLKSLKTIKIMELKQLGDLAKVDYFLDNAKVLEKIIFDDVWTEEFTLDVAKKLSRFCKSSTACEFHLQ